MPTLFFDPHVFQTIDPGSFTVNDLIAATLKLIGAIAGVETPSPDQQNDALARLNDMLDAWAANSLTIFQVVPTEYPLVSGQQTYTIGKGAGANFNAVRPSWIQRAGIISTATTPQFELPMRILNSDEWSEITIKSVPSTLSWYLWYDYAFPNGNIRIWPIPSVSSLKLALYVPTPVTRFTTVTAPLAYPPGWSEALRYNLAVRLCPEWGRPIDPVVAAIAQQSLATLERSNTRPALLGMDASLVGSQRHVFNWLTGSSGDSGGR
jgi:hypothetical protein